MDTKKIERWAQLLLDTGKRNNLINFKDSKASTAEIVFPDTESFFNKCTGSSTAFEVYAPQLDDDDEEVQLSIDFSEESENVEDDRPKKEAYVSKYSSKIKKANQILVYSDDPNPFSVIKKIHKRAKSFMEETGVNVSHIAFGFVHWKESENSQFVYRAPILLVPISLVNDSSVSPYYIRSSDEDVIVNPTFSYLLNAQYGITLPEYQDEGLTPYLEKIRSIVGKMRWTVSDECKIGIFSFLKINMYHDLMDNKDQIIKNSNIQRILGEGDEARTESEYSDKDEERTSINDIVEFHTVVDADSSQMEAIELAKSGKSFVLQGPPGTGKSQTITNIIAECLYDGKKVLFVSEKQAALNVVFDKLKKAGLEDFCLELHSHKANKKAVIDELCRTLRAERIRVSSKADAEVETKARLQKKLDAYAEELHRPIEVIDKSMFQLYSAYSAFRNAPDVDYKIKNIEDKDERFLNESANLLDQYAEYIQTIGADYRKNVWYGYKGCVSSRERIDQFKRRLNVTIQCLRSLDGIIKKCSETYGLSADCRKDLIANQHLLEQLGEMRYDSPELLQTSDLGNCRVTVLRLQELSRSIISYKHTLDETFDERVYGLDAQGNYDRLIKLYSGTFSRLMSAEYKGIITEIKLFAKPGTKVNYTLAVKSMSDLAEYNKREKEFEDREEGLQSLFGNEYQGLYTDWDRLLGEIDSIQSLKDEQIDFGEISALSDDQYRESKADFKKTAADIGKLLDLFDQAKAVLQRDFDTNVIDFDLMSINSMLAKLYECYQSTDKIENWIRFNVLLEQLKERDLIPFVVQIINSNVSAEYVSMAFRKRFYEQWIDHEMYLRPVFAEFTRVSQDKAVEQFSEKDRLQFDISKAQIRSELSAKRPSLDLMASGSSVSVLLREGEKKRKQKPIRKLLENIGDLVQVLKPCFLMSPLSVSTFLTNKALTFDTIIFDEASQIFPQDAVGAIYRGNQLIVVGDSKQMPPSNFFNSSVEVDDEDEETGDVTDFESVLDICCGTSMTQRRLKWHYRSKCEQLITFSNRNFYDNTLVTFPAASTKHKGFGVDYYGVNGIYDRKSHTNREEAEYIVDLVFENIDKFPKRSMGVVAFSVAQQDLIDNLLSKKRRDDTSKEWYFSQDLAEPFFIKNLETVQGDERDTIIFSVAYGRDAQGRLLHNFGPLNRKGGERRLNVAVTRAKYNVQLVSSMHATDIDLTKTTSEGAHLLRGYLDYAENGDVALERSVTVNPFEEYDSEFEMDVCDFLREQGFSVDTQIGCSGFKIDLGLKRAEGSDYVLAIECDGATYHSSKNARDRDRLRQEVLESMGWRFYRIWSTDWFRNTTVEKERLVKAATEAVHLGSNTERESVEENTTGIVHSANSEESSIEADTLLEQDDGQMTFVEEEEQEKPTTSIEFEETIENAHLQFPKYQEVSIYAGSPLASLSRQDMVRKILEVESPMSEDYLLKRIVFLYGREKVTSTVKQQFRYEMRGCEKRGIVRNNGFLYLKDRKSYVLRVPGVKRDIKHIAPEELASGMYIIIKQNISIDKDSLFRSIINLLGYNRMGETVTKKLEQAFHLLDSVVIACGDTISLISK